MSTVKDGHTTSRPAAAATALYLRVYENSSGEAAIAGLTTEDMGVADRVAAAAGEAIPIRLRTAPTSRMIANGAVTRGALVYTAASGKVSASQLTGAMLRGRALEAAANDGDAIEVAPLWGENLNGAAQTVTADDSEVAGLNMILPGVDKVYVDGVTNDANDFIVLPALASVPDGFRITVVGQAGANFEVRTPAASNEEINSEDCDGTKEYLFTNTQIHEFVKIDDTIGWMGHGYSAIGAVVTAVVPD